MNETLIDKLGITKAEQKHMKTMIEIILDEEQRKEMKMDELLKHGPFSW